MKKIVFMLITGFLIIGIYSCTPESISIEDQEIQACCGEENEDPPPPPPPPPPIGG